MNSMKNIKILSLLVTSLISTNIYALGDDEQSYCFSTDPELGDSAYWASAAINFYNSGQHKKAIRLLIIVLNIMQKTLYISKVN
jgi:hypothetical protein